MARTNVFEELKRKRVEKVRAELQAQEKRYRNAEIDHRARADKAADQIGQQAARLYHETQAACYYGRADGIREALRAYAERGL